jgi:aspartate/methionine/tyrosine aminotransferase
LKEVTELQAKGKPVISFCIGQPDFITPENIRNAAKRAIDAGKTGYTPSPGIPELRKAIAEHISETRNIDVNMNDVVVANGAKAFIDFAILSTTDAGKGHEVIMPNPSYPIYEAGAVANGAIPVRVPLLEREQFAFDLDVLEKKITKNTKLLFINSPQNPTGGILKKKDLERIAEIAIKHDLWVYSDEIYCRIFHEEGKYESIASIPEVTDRVIIQDGASKIYAMTGWRMGFAVNRKLAPSFSTLMTNLEGCPNHIAQYAYLEALTGPQDDAKKMAHSFTRRRDLIVSLLNKIPGFKCHPPGGAFYAWPNVTEACKMLGVKDSEEFRKKLLYEANIAVLSDIHFGPRNEGEGQHIRFSYATSEENIKKGLEIVKEYVEKNAKY